jgi:transcriptional regulator with XRE-family HTH domain
MARESFGTRLRSLRERAGLTQTQLARKAGTDQGHISQWERNASQPDMATVKRLAAVLQTSAAELLTGRPEKPAKRTIRLTADSFATHVPTDYASSLVEGLTIPEDGLDYDDWIVSKLLAWLALQSEKSSDVRYEMSRHVAAILLERLARGR